LLVEILFYRLADCCGILQETVVGKPIVVVGRIGVVTRSAKVNNNNNNNNNNNKYVRSHSAAASEALVEQVT